MRLSHLFVLPLILTMAACAHEAENTGADNASNTTIVLPAAYAMQTRAAAVAEDSPVAPGSISRFQRQVIIPGGMDGAMTPCAKNFDGIMDHLESLMMPQIEENNRIAAAQAVIPRYPF